MKFDVQYIICTKEYDKYKSYDIVCRRYSCPFSVKTAKGSYRLSQNTKFAECMEKRRPFLRLFTFIKELKLSPFDILFIYSVV